MGARGRSIGRERGTGVSVSRAHCTCLEIQLRCVSPVVSGPVASAVQQRFLSLLCWGCYCYFQAAAALAFLYACAKSRKVPTRSTWHGTGKDIWPLTPQKNLPQNTLSIRIRKDGEICLMCKQPLAHCQATNRLTEPRKRNNVRMGNITRLL